MSRSRTLTAQFTHYDVSTDDETKKRIVGSKSIGSEAKANGIIDSVNRRKTSRTARVL